MNLSLSSGCIGPQMFFGSLKSLGTFEFGSFGILGYFDKLLILCQFFFLFFSISRFLILSLSAIAFRITSFFLSSSSSLINFKYTFFKFCLLFQSLSEASVTKMSVVLRKAYGAGLYAMCGPGFAPENTLARDSARRKPADKKPRFGSVESGAKLTG